MYTMIWHRVHFANKKNPLFTDFRYFLLSHYLKHLLEESVSISAYYLRIPFHEIHILCEIQLSELSHEDFCCGIHSHDSPCAVVHLSHSFHEVFLSFDIELIFHSVFLEHITICEAFCIGEFMVYEYSEHIDL